MSKISVFNLPMSIVLLMLFMATVPTMAQMSKKEQKENRDKANKIMNNSDNYYYGKGEGATFNEASLAALSYLQSQIKVVISQDIDMIATHTSTSQNVDSQNKAVVRTHSTTGGLLTNTNTITLQEEPEWVVVRYVEKKEIERMENLRRERMEECVTNARRCEDNGRIGDALHYFYWASCLANSMTNPDGEKLHVGKYGETTRALPYIQNKMNDIFEGLMVEATNTDSEGNVTLLVKYKGEEVTNICLSYDDGTGMRKTVTATGGVAEIHFAEGSTPERLQVDYAYEGLDRCNIDDGLDIIVRNSPKRPFTQAHAIVDLSDKHQQRQAKRDIQDAVANVSQVKHATEASHYGDCRKAVKEIMKAIQTKKYESVKHLFTSEGYDIYERLIVYGKVRLIGEAKPQFYEAPNGRIVCRAVPMRFDFPNNHISFTEAVTFTFAPDHRIESLAFGLDNDTRDAIFNNDAEWSDSVRMAIATFLENYKTAYALERIDYIRDIFDDYAIIITGTVTQRVIRDGDSGIKLKEDVNYNTFSKDEYLNRLEEQFRQKRFINLRFTNVGLTKLDKGGDFFGMSIKQDYFSDNYNDDGYLYLMVDMNEPDRPLINVRVWQRYRDPKITPNLRKDDPRFGFIYEGNFKY